MKIFKLISNLFYFLLIGAIVLLALATAFSIFEAPGHLRTFVVMSGSMEPNIKTASVVVVMPQEQYQVGDVITFKRDLNANLKDPGSTVTHRIAQVKDDEGRPTFVTKGDANQTPDAENVEIARVLGKIVFTVPLVGRAVAFAKTQMGFVVLIIIPATLIVYSEIMSIKKEIARMLKNRRDKKKAQAEKATEKSEKNEES